LAIGAEQNYENETDAGHVRVFKNNSGVWEQRGADVDGVFEGDKLGGSVALNANGDIFASGAPFYSHSGINKGIVKTYQFYDAPEITTQPLDQTGICLGEVVSFIVSGNNVTDFQWQVSIDNGSSWVNLSDNTSYSGSLTNTLDVNSVLRFNNQLYRCEFTGAGGIAISDSSILILDATAPTFTSTHPDQIISATTGCDQAVLPNYIVDVTSLDNCTSSGDLDINQSPHSGTDISGAINLVTLTVTDEVGNSTEIQFNVAVVDNINPTLVVQNYTIELDSTGNAILLANDIVTNASDNCTVVDTTLSQTALNCSNIGIPLNIDVTITDASGNSTTEITEITVVDNTVPNLTCIGNQTTSFSSGDHYTVSGNEFDLTYSNDNCGIASVENDINSTNSLDGVELPEGITTITWTVTDNAGNTNNCSFDVEVTNTVRIEEINSQKINIYPNPTTGIIMIDAIGINRIEVIDSLNGQLLKSGGIMNNTVDITELINGLYVLQITDNSRFNKYRIKIIKE